jgi:hypothetical protein
MEASRAFQTGASSSKRIWTIVAVVLAALALAVAGAFLASAMTTGSSAAGGSATKASVQAPRVGAGGRHFAVEIDRGQNAPVGPAPDGLRLR